MHMVQVLQRKTPIGGQDPRLNNMIGKNGSIEEKDEMVVVDNRVSSDL